VVTTPLPGSASTWVTVGGVVSILMMPEYLDHVLSFGPESSDGKLLAPHEHVLG
jgi:hypothetical protein